MIAGVGLVALIVVAVVARALYQAQPAPSLPPVVAPPTVPTTIAYTPRRGPGGTTILTEPVDLVSLAIPRGWKALSPDENTLPNALGALGRQMPPMASLLQAEAVVAAKAAVRLFAYQPSAPYAFLTVISYSSPSATPLTPAVVAASVAASKKLTSGVAVSGEQLPLGEALRLDSTVSSQNQHLVSELLILVVASRTLMVQMVSDVSTPGIPAVFSQIARSLRPS